MENNNTKYLVAIEKLTKENNELQQKLDEANRYINAVKIGSIDAFVIGAKDKLKVYAEKSADKVYRILIEEMHEGAVTTDKEGTILYCNSCFAGMVRLPLQKVIGTKLVNYITLPLHKHPGALFKQAWLQPIKEQAYIYKKTGEVIPVLMSANVLQVDDNTLLSIILTDLTVQTRSQADLKKRSGELQEKNIELETANKDLLAFAFVSSHNLQEPLRKIQLFVGILLDEQRNALSEIGKGYLQKTSDTARQMRGLIDDLLDYWHIMNGEQKLEKLDLSVVMNEIANEFKEEMHEKKAKITVTNLCDVNIIPIQFHELMRRLISNSLKFARPLTAPRITIKNNMVRGSKLKNARISPGGNYSHITYIDNGIGIDPQYSNLVFGIFQRLHSNEQYEGTGIGLAICKRIVENHHGSISLTGKVNKGIRFDIYIPA